MTISNQTYETCKIFLQPALASGALSENDFNQVISTIKEQTNPKTIDPNKLISVKEVREITGKSKQGIYLDIKKGLLPKYKIGGSTRFYLSDVYAMLHREG